LAARKGVPGRKLVAFGSRFKRLAGRFGSIVRW
jgi:hypothetical protein